MDTIWKDPAETTWKTLVEIPGTTFRNRERTPTKSSKELFMGAKTYLQMGNWRKTEKKLKKKTEKTDEFPGKWPWTNSREH